jgi:hypothetical protein
MSHPLQDLYDRVPKVACKGHCGTDRHNSCCGPIGCSVIEAKILDSYMGIKSPWEDYSAGQVKMTVAALGLSRTCPHLGLDGRCRSYAVRPLICRIWGTIKKLRCPWGCVPERWLTDHESYELLDEAVRRSVKTLPTDILYLPEDAGVT